MKRAHSLAIALLVVILGAIQLPAAAADLRLAANKPYAIVAYAPKPDVTLEPIACDEPIASAGFPPLPDRMDIPVAGSWMSSNAGYPPAARSQAPAAANRPVRPEYHQHYGHLPAETFMQKQQSGHGYYKAQSSGGDYYSGNGGTPRYKGAAGDVANLGPEPKLMGEALQTPAAPTPVVVSQSTTQDLSLPEDSEVNGRPKSSSSHNPNNLTNGLYRMMALPLRMGMLSGVRF